MVVIVLPCKLLSKIGKCIFNVRRFGQVDEHDALIQKFKNLYSSLTMGGRFKEGERIKENGDGEKSYFSFVRKCFTLNMNTRTEKVLDCLLERYRKNHDTFDEAAIDSIIAEMKKQYTVGCIDRKDEIEHIHDEIDALAGFIKGYLLDVNQEPSEAGEEEPGAEEQKQEAGAGQDEQPGEAVFCSSCEVPKGLYRNKQKGPSWAEFFRGKQDNLVVVGEAFKQLPRNRVASLGSQ
jgi:hypothetical protein